MWYSNLPLWKVISNPEQLLRVLFCSTSSSSHLHGKCRSFFFCLRQCENGFSNLLCLGHGLLSVSFLSLDSSTYFVIKGWFFWWNTILLCSRYLVHQICALCHSWPRTWWAIKNSPPQQQPRKFNWDRWLNSIQNLISRCHQHFSSGVAQKFIFALEVISSI